MDTLKWNKVVIGGTIEAITYACINNCYLLSSNYNYSSPTRFIPPNQDLSHFGLENTTTTITSEDGDIARGLPIDIFRDQILRLMIMCGLAPITDQRSLSISYTPEGLIRISTRKGISVRIEFDELHIFQAPMLRNFPLAVDSIGELVNIVYDTFSYKGTLNHDLISGINDFPIEIERIGDQLISKSHLTSEELRDFDFGPLITQKAVGDRLSEYCLRQGLKGIRKLEHIRRSVVPLQSISYIPEANIFHKSMNLEEILNMEHKMSDYYYKIKNLI